MYYILCLQGKMGNTKWKTNKLLGCHIDATEQQRALNLELVVSDQYFSVILEDSKFSALCVNMTSKLHNILVTSLPKKTRNEVTKLKWIAQYVGKFYQYFWTKFWNLGHSVFCCLLLAAVYLIDEGHPVWKTGCLRSNN